MKVVILCGGMGTRLGRFTQFTPKPMIRVLGKTILEYQFENLKKYNLRDIILCIGYLGDTIINYYGNGKKFGVSIRYIVEKSPMGTGGPLHYLKEFIDDDFILLFGDIIFYIDWDKFINFHKLKDGVGTFIVHPNNHPFDSDLVLVDDTCKINSISYKNSERQYYKNIVKSGIHIFKKEIFNFVELEKKQDLEKDIVGKMLTNNYNFYAYKTPEYIKDMGTCERLKQVSKDLQKDLPFQKALCTKQKCIFLDRDGTINKFRGLLHDIDKFQLETLASEAIRLINSSGYLCIMVTNQSVVARNLCTITELDNIHGKMETLLGNQGAYLDDIYYCPHHPDGGYPEENKAYKIKCHCRKPDTGMIDMAAEKYNIDLSRSFIIGDSLVDIKTGINAGLHTILLTADQHDNKQFLATKPEYIFKNLYDAVNFILNSHQDFVR
jgi:mannose-1-phosphate guanylyltransferase/phosphomannomutase